MITLPLLCMRARGNYKEETVSSLFSFPFIFLAPLSDIPFFLAHPPCIHVGASVHAISLPFRVQFWLPGPSGSYPKLHWRVHSDKNSLMQGGNIAPFSGAFSGSQSLGSHLALRPDQVLEGRHVRILEPLSVYPSLQLNRQDWPVWFPHGSTLPLRGAGNVGHCCAAWKSMSNRIFFSVTLNLRTQLILSLSREKPLEHAHLKLPSVLTQRWWQLSAPDEHSSISTMH